MKQVVRVMMVGLLVHGATVIAMDRAEKKVSFKDDESSSEGSSTQPLTGRTPRGDDDGSVISMASSGDVPALPQDDTGKKEEALPWNKAANECEAAVMVLYDKAKNAPNGLVKSAWTQHYEKYRRLFYAIIPDPKQKKVDAHVIGIQKDYIMLKQRAEKKAAQNIFEMLVKTYPKSIVAAASATTAVVVPLTYVATSAVYKRLHKNEEEDFGSDEEDKKLDEVCIDDCDTSFLDAEPVGN